ncbi:unnamed protein product, partial [Mesorhabditis belari]|uniref:Uncharacterized protein n=1 Tax=Mesorhabditis belari TaxID=2138241 RepID=A0AAF3EBB3_9BILA
MTLAALDIGFVILILSIYLWLLVFYIGATFVLLHFSKKVASYQSKKMLKMQKIAFWLLIIQAAGCLFPAGLTMIILTIAFLTESPGVTLAFNCSYWFLFTSFGFVYPIVILLTTRPYVNFVQKFISMQINLSRTTKDESPAKTSWASPSKAKGLFDRRFTMIGPARVNRVINS